MEYSKRRSQQAKLKIFQVIQKNFLIIGISPKLATQSYPINGKLFLGFLTLTLALISACVFIFHEAETLVEYAQSSYMGSIATLVLGMLFITVFNVEKIFALINLVDRAVNTCKLQTVWVYFAWFYLFFAKFQHLNIQQRDPFCAQPINWKRHWVKSFILWWWN